MENAFTQKNAKEYRCDICDYKCCNKYDYMRHLSTRKHSVSLSGNSAEIKKTQYECKCGKEYKSMSGLWKHKNICIEYKNHVNKDKEKEILIVDDLSKKDDLIEYLIKENSEFKNLILELIKKDNTVTNNTNCNNNNNNNNKTFNLQFFLNETCKDALNIGEFVDSIKLQLSDLETIGRIGYVEGVSKILIKNLNELDTCKRPIHCSDLKREVLYIKDDDKWLKENDEKLVIKKAIKDVANKNIKQIPEWMRKNPNCNSSDSNKNDQYLQIVMNSMSGGSNEEQHNNIEKIVKNITKSVIIDK
jgi:hypothetical protein